MSQAGERCNPNIEQCCSCCAMSDEIRWMEEAGHSFPLQGEQLRANLLHVLKLWSLLASFVLQLLVQTELE